MAALTLVLPRAAVRKAPVACHWPRCRMPDGSCDEGRQCVN